ncbi:ethanolamine ammonia-lyase reactivating factor EutA [Paenibacillus aceris]|uniref:Ethanolamine utilization protein EutA n=1 Tax=Paenibacillus aceris TaxID=869555 RepID=A0ABS4I6C8_9BACL|nr:ethanolamine ammonia-lyase reactivating factor EutA [Paenibacillus aceris]MBP1966462.1 ethanolamine utilization protein EutA [Paenibacillus aceris]NHW39558.1 ethanolamine ammonia-lyase reactivating factor EutA [Paenibacillus aceris]
MADQWITSVGLDIGTSTTKMVISRLKIVRSSGALSLPRFGITERELLYASPIYSTPLLSSNEIHAERIWDIVAGEYAQAGIGPADVKSGAVIITGETANKTNAKHILHLLAERAGDFVVATAGADLEGLLAGKGAGAERRSLQLRGAVANIDIGGGTANAAIFLRGKLLGTVTFHVGGRLIRIDSTGTILEVSPSIRPWLITSGYNMNDGDRISLAQLNKICTAMCRCMMDYLSGRDPGAALRALMIGSPLAMIPSIEEWMVSGGIGLLMAQTSPQSLADAALHGDIGPLLAQAWKELAAGYPIRHTLADQTVRATVIGAGMQSTEISGATVHLDATLLPIRNLPVLKLELSPQLLARSGELADLLDALMRSGASLFDQELSPPFGLALSGTNHLTYSSLQYTADQLYASFSRHFPHSEAMVIICETDIAKALGQSLSRRCGLRPKIICIDQIRVEHGDYIDLGEPISGIMIPVVVKTLAFQGKA